MKRISPREATRIMQRLGMQVKELEDVMEVIIIKKGDKKIVIEGPSVTLMNVQGQSVYQILGGRVREEAIEPTVKAYVAMDEDISLVMQQTGKSYEDAKKALEESEGDLAKAILILQGSK
ncbi:MAG: nascent polypeptide-associated complex protein [Candidatus Bathyarchaeia archaeon]